MRVAASQRGFTIVETMIVLAITAALFLVAFNAVGGKQNETEFQQAINDAQSSMQHIIGEARTGTYQQVSNLQCAPSISTLSISSGSNPNINGDSGTGACEFIGDAVEFETPASGNPEPYYTYPIMGASTNSGTSSGSLPSNALPTAVAPGATVNTTIPDMSVISYLHNGLVVQCMGYYTVATNPLPSPLCSSGNTLNGSNSVNISTIGFISTLGNQSGGGQLLSGSQDIWLVPVAGTALGETSRQAVDQIDGTLGPPATPSGLVTGTTVNPPSGVAVCMASGTSNQSGLLTIGGNGGANLNSITVTIFSGTDC